MPRTVDRNSRRLRLIEAASDVLRRHGLTGLTTRRIAEEAGEPKGALAHYFDSKAELVTELIGFHHRRSGARFIAALEAEPGIAGLRAAMLEALPLDDGRLADAQVEISYAAASLGDPSLRAWYREQRTLLHAVVTERVAETQRRGELGRHLDDGAIATALLTLMDGLSLQSVLLESVDHRRDQIDQLDRLFARLAAQN